MLTETARWVLGALAVFRLTWTVVYDDGPWDLLTRARERLGVYEVQANGQPPSGLPSFLACAYCVSRLLALLVVPFILWPSKAGDFLIAWYGLAGAIALLIRWRPWNNY